MKEGELVCSLRRSVKARAWSRASARWSTAVPVSPERVLCTDCTQASAPHAPADFTPVIQGR